MAYIQSNNPFKKADVRRTIGRGKNFNPVSINLSMLITAYVLLLFLLNIKTAS